MPDAVKLRLRQESGFGCCKCGHPFIEYHHIIPYAEDAHFRPEDMMALCPNCHDLCTARALSESQQRSFKANPRNIAERRSLGRLYVTTNELRVELAGGLAINTPELLNVRGEVMLAVRLSSDGRVLVSAIIHDQLGRSVGRLVDNEWLFDPNGVFDLKVAPRKATVRSARRKVSFEVESRNESIRVKGSWFVDGMPMTFSPTAATVGTNQIRCGTVSNARGFIRVN